MGQCALARVDRPLTRPQEHAHGLAIPTAPWLGQVGSAECFAGGAHGYFRTGRLLELENETSFSDMLVTCFHYMGFDNVTEFGDERLRLKGPLAGVTA